MTGKTMISVTLLLLGTICVHLINLGSGSNKIRAEEDIISASAEASCTQMPHGTVKNGLAAFLLPACGNARISTGQPVPVAFGVMFLGRPGSAKDEMRIWPVVLPADPVNLSWFSVKDPDGGEVHYGGPALDYVLPLPPDDISTLSRNCFYGMSFDLAEYYDFQRPGTYTITWYYSASGRGAWQGELISNEITLEFR